MGNTKKEYKKGKHTVYSCQYHVIFCSKYRKKILNDDVEKRLKYLILEKQNEYGYKILGMEIMPDHVHLIIDTSPEIGIHKIVSKIKGYTSHTLRREFKVVRSRIPTLWTLSKFISSVGSVSLNVVKKYIENQKNV